MDFSSCLKAAKWQSYCFGLVSLNLMWRWLEAHRGKERRARQTELKGWTPAESAAAGLGCAILKAPSNTADKCVPQSLRNKGSKG